MATRCVLPFALACIVSVEGADFQIRPMLERNGSDWVVRLDCAQPVVEVPVNRPRPAVPLHPWRRNIVTTVFWIGENGGAATRNIQSSWDIRWSEAFGGTDHPEKREGYRPSGFNPKQNPFYIALPYNDIGARNVLKPEAGRVIPWFRRTYRNAHTSVIKGRWVAIRKGSVVCYAQWEDSGPTRTDDFAYVFHGSPPAGGIDAPGLDVSPAVRDFLKLSGRDRTDWRFVETSEVPDGPWCRDGANNIFAAVSPE